MGTYGVVVRTTDCMALSFGSCAILGRFLTSLCLSFLVRETGIITVPVSWDCRDSADTVRGTEPVSVVRDGSAISYY